MQYSAVQYKAYSTTTIGGSVDRCALCCHARSLDVDAVDGLKVFKRCIEEGPHLADASLTMCDVINTAVA